MIWIIALAIVAAIGLLALALPKLDALRTPAPPNRSHALHGPEPLLSRASTGAWRCDLATGTSTRDATLSAMLGLEAVEATEKLEEFFARLVPEDVAPTRSELARAIRERDGYSTVFRIVRDDASTRWLRGRGEVVCGAGGTATHLNTTIRDTTERHAADTALRQSEEKFAKAFQASPDLMAISDMDDGGIIEVNDRFEIITGFSRAESLGRSMADLGLIDAALRTAQLAIAREHGSFRDFEFDLRRKDGRFVTILISGEVFEIGGRQRLLTVGRDITYTKRAEEALHRSESKYRELVENANDVVFTIDPGGICHPMNRAGQTIAGFAASGVAGTHLSRVVVPEQADIARERVERVLAGDDVPVFEVDMLDVEGPQARFEVNLRPIWKDGLVIAAQGIARDVTARTKLEQQLRQGQRMDAVGRLAAGIAHDFNNLLTVILGNCEVGVAGLIDADPRRRSLDVIRESAERAATLTSQLLAFTQQQIVQPRILDVNDTLADARRMLTRLVGEQITVNFTAGAGVWHVRADPGQLHQILVSLVVNSRDSMPDGGELTIQTNNVQLAEPHLERGATVPPGDYVEVVVRDTGGGMSAATLERLFEPFFTSRDLGKGDGLGLATVYGIVKQNNGFVFAESEPGVGSAFRVLLPRADAPITTPAADNPARDTAPGRGTVVLVEDEAAVRELIGAYLTRQGYQVVTASSGEEAVDGVRDWTESPVLLISDIVMPGMNGRVLSDRLRLTYPELKVLFVSGYTDDAVVSNGSLAPGTHFMQKPFALSALAAKVTEIVDRG